MKRTCLSVVCAITSAFLAYPLFAQPASAPAGGQAELLFDFEQGGKDLFDGADKAEFVADHATHGKTAMKMAVEKDKTTTWGFGFYRNTNAAGRWGQFDRFVVDVFVEGGPVKVYCLIRDDQGTDWNARYNVEFQLQPGKRKIEIPIGSITREKDHKPMNVDKLSSVGFAITLVQADKPATVFLDNGRLEKGSAGAAVKTLFSFEGADKGKYVLEDWPPETKGASKLNIVEEHATDGKKSLCLESHAEAGNVQFTLTNEDTNWSEFDALAIDLFNPSDKPVRIGGWIKNKPDDSYDNRHGWQRVLKPGFNCLRLTIGALEFPDGRRTLDSAHVGSFNLATDNQTVFIDNIRLIKGTEEIPVEGIRKFDFGPKAGAVMPGFTAVSRESAYDKAKGFGWKAGGDFSRDFDIREVMNRHRPFDDLIRDSASPNKAAFLVDVPNGEYQVWLMMNVPGGNVWHRAFKHRTVTINGQPALDEKYTPESFKTWEYQWQDTEDLPGDDIWDRYINSVYKPLLTDVKVTDGQIAINFDSHGEYFGCMVCGLAIWPKAQETQAQKWVSALNAQRKDQYYTLHVEQPPRTPAAPDPTISRKATLIRFVYSPDRDIQVNSTPTDAEIDTKAIDLAAVPGEYQDGCFGLFAMKDSGKLTAVVSDLEGPSGAKIPAAALSLQVLRYKALNHDAIYSIEPRYLDRMPDGGVDIRKGVTRSLWLIAKVPAEAKAGAYTGRIDLSLDGKASDTIPVKLTVWPIKLSEPDMPMGMFITTPQDDAMGLTEGPQTKEARFAAWKTVLEDYRAHGMTSVDPDVSAPIKEVKDGKAVIDFTDLDRWMEMAKSAGFTKELCGYALGTGLGLRPQTLDNGGGDKMAQGFGLKTYGELVKAYFDAFREHAKEKSYLPICFASDDEFLIHPGAGPKQLEEYGKILKDNAPDFHFVALDSIYPDEKPDQCATWEKMMKQIDTWGAGLHSPKMAELVKKAGSRLWLYNTGMDRFTFGTYMFWANKKYDVKGFFEWVYPSGGTLTKYDLASHRESWFGVVYPSDRGLRTTPVWERIRGGCNDHRYLQTAWELIAANKDGAKAADAKALQATIDATFAKLQFGKSRVDPASGDDKANNPMDPAQMEKFRRALAEGIAKLQAP